MAGINILEKIKRLTIIALVSDDALMGVLVLKGGNALNIGYAISDRGSLDIDFSIESDYTDKEKTLVCKQIIKYMTPKSRARDFYDIFNLIQNFKMDFLAKENIALAHDIFNAKKVPLNFILQIDAQRELHRDSWESVIQTINQQEELKDFDFYSDFVLENFSHLGR